MTHKNESTTQTIKQPTNSKRNPAASKLKRLEGRTAELVKCSYFHLSWVFWFATVGNILVTLAFFSISRCGHWMWVLNLHLRRTQICI